MSKSVCTLGAGIGLALMLTGCGTAGTRSPETGAFEDFFELVDRVVIEEPDTAPLTDVRAFSPAPNGQLLVVDQGRPQVRLFDRHGGLIRIVGRYGSAPGEFERPADARTDSRGRLLVVDGGRALITRFTPDLEVDTIFRLQGMSIHEIDRVGDGRIFSILWNEPHPPHDFLAAVTTEDGELVRGLHPVDSLIWAVPYWSSFAGAVGASGSARIVTANRFFYPLHLYDAGGNHLRDFGSPPPSWREPTRPEAGEFVGAGGFDRLAEWLGSMTVISRLGVYRDSAIVVVHATPTPTTTSVHERRDDSLDIYSVEGIKIAEDVPVPARVLRIEDHLYLLETMPPEGWTLGIYRLKSDYLRGP